MTERRGTGRGAEIATGASGTGARILTAEDLLAMAQPDPGLRIAYGPHPEQFGRLTLPPTGAVRAVALFLHGGCWLAEYDIRHTGRLEAALAEQGFAVWSLEYRRVGQQGGGWPGTFTDVAKGADHLRVLSREYGLDLGRVMVAGHSAGGHLAIWLACRSRLPVGSPLRTPDPLPVHAVLALAPAAALELLWEAGTCDGAVQRLMGGGPRDVPERYASASPMALVPLGLPTTVLLGARDVEWTPAGRAFYQAARSAGDDEIDVVEVAGAGHFELIVPGTSAWSHVRRAAEALVRRLPPA